MNAPTIILVEPQMGENIGATARAMCNFSLTDLRLVAPRDGWPNAAAVQNASGAFDLMPAPQIFESLEDATQDLQTLYATTARPRDMVKPVITPKTAITDIKQTNHKTGIIFGRERTGLENDHIALCHSIIEIPTNPGFSSLNLAQAVLVLGYEWALTQTQTPKTSHDPAPQSEVTNLLTRLEDELETAGFFREKNLKPTMIRNIRALITRAHMTDQETRTLHGIISALTGNKKAGK